MMTSERVMALHPNTELIVVPHVSPSALADASNHDWLPKFISYE